MLIKKIILIITKNALEIIDKNGLIIIDNVLWHGEVVDKMKNDKFTNIIREFNNMLRKIIEL